MCAIAGQFADRVEKLDEETLKHELQTFLAECTNKSESMLGIESIHVAPWRSE